MNEPKKHHYISQFYLAGFTEDSKKESNLYCYDLIDKKMRISKPMNECFEKHFNKLDISEDNPNELERALAQSEDIISKSFKYIIENKSIPKGEQLKELIYYIAMLGVRNPSIRNSFDKFQNEVFFKALSLSLKNKEDWEKFIQESNKEHDDRFANITYEEMKKYIMSREWKIVEPNEDKILREFETIDIVYSLCMKRFWSLLIIEDSDNFFITSDRPVKLIWNNKNNQEFGPGFGERNSELVFPINKQILLWGSFINPSVNRKNVSFEEIASINTMQLIYYNRHLYSPKENFFIKKNNRIISSKSLLLS